MSQPKPDPNDPDAPVTDRNGVRLAYGCAVVTNEDDCVEIIFLGSDSQPFAKFISSVPTSQVIMSRMINCQEKLAGYVRSDETH